MSFSNRFRRSTLFLIKKKYPNLDFLDTDFSMIKGNDVPDSDDCIDEGFDIELGPFEDVAALESATDSLVDPPIVNIDSLSPK